MVPRWGPPRCRWIVHRWGELEITPVIRGPKTQGSQFSGGLEIQKKPAIQSQNPLQKGREPMLGGCLKTQANPFIFGHLQGLFFSE